MIRYRLTMPESEYPRPPEDLPAEWLARIPKPPTVVISLDVEGPNDIGPLRLEGRLPAFNWEIETQLAGAWGLYTSIDMESTTPIDLEAAMLSGPMKKYEPELLEGQEVLDSFVNDTHEIESKGGVR